MALVSNLHLIGLVNCSSVDLRFMEPQCRLGVRACYLVDSMPSPPVSWSVAFILKRAAFILKIALSLTFVL